MSLSFGQPAALWALLLVLPLLLAPLVPRLGGGAGIRRLRGIPRRLWVSAGIRLLIALALILSLAGTQLVRAANGLTVVYLLDLSDSLPAAERERAEEFIGQSIAAMPPGDRAAIVAFGQNALVERLASDERTVTQIGSTPVAVRTDIAGAIQLGLALFPEDGRKRIVILSDGLENVGEAAAQAELASAHGVQVAYVPLAAPAGEAETYIERLEAPANVRQGQRFDVTAVVESTSAQRAILDLYSGNALVRSVEVTLQPGTNRVRAAVDADQPGFKRYRAELRAERDTLAQNNTAAGFTVVQGPPRVLIVEGSREAGEQLAAALTAAQVGVERIRPEETPGDLAALSAYHAVFLADAPAGALPPAAMEALPRYVKDLGRGLVMVGGEGSFGAGGYLRTPVEQALPVDMDVRNKEQEPNLALVLAVDKSGSMGRCHCDDPSLLPGQYARVQSGLPKVDIAKEAILRTYAALGRLDFLGVVMYDKDAHWALRLQPLVNADQLQGAVGGVEAFGQTNIYAGLSEAEAALKDADARVKHIILLTDGWSMSGAYDDLVKQMREQGITLSIVAAGRGSAPYLERLAEEGGGRYYAAQNIEDLPQVFLKETIQAAGRYIVEQPFYPIQSGSSPILDGIGAGAVPGLYGYNGTTAKSAARVVLSSPDGDPVLAQWQYGLGRAVAWTPDLAPRWAAEWVKWDEFARFAGQLTAWVLPQPASRNLQTALTTQGSEVQIDVDAVDAAGRPWNFLNAQAAVIGPDLVAQQVTLAQTAPGHYRGAAPAGAEGTYLVQITAAPAGAEGSAAGVQSATQGFVVAYSPEYKHASAEPGLELLRGLARSTGGTELSGPPAAWERTGPPARAAQPIAMPLLLIAALLFPVDVALRRLRLGRREWENAVARVARLGRTTPTRKSAPASEAATPTASAGAPAERSEPSSPVLGGLQDARVRVRVRAAPGVASAQTRATGPRRIDIPTRRHSSTIATAAARQVPKRRAPRAYDSFTVARPQRPPAALTIATLPTGLDERRPPHVRPPGLMGADGTTVAA